MKIYWTLKSIPEYRNADKTLIRRTWMPSYWKTFKHWQQWVMTAAVISYLLYFFSIPTNVSWTVEITIGLTLALILAAWSQISIAFARPYLRELLKTQDEQLQSESGAIADQKTGGKLTFTKVLKFIIGLVCIAIGSIFTLGFMILAIGGKLPNPLLTEIPIWLLIGVLPFGIGVYILLPRKPKAISLDNTSDAD